MRVVLIDNDDSFTRNLEHLLVACTGHRPDIVNHRNLKDTGFLPCDLAVISAGPGRPSEYPDYKRLLGSDVPLLGICLGMQIINEHYGGKTKRLPNCIHGKTDTILFRGEHRVVARYHSLYLDPVADCLEVIAQNSIGIPMAVRHRKRKIIGYQFHPESFMTPDGGYFVNYAVDLLIGVRPGEVPGACRDTRTML